MKHFLTIAAISISLLAVGCSNDSDPATETTTPTTEATPTAGLFSETSTDSTVSYEGIVNSVDWGGNSTVADTASTAVTPLEGTYVLSVDYKDGGAGWGGAVFNFGDAGTDLSSYGMLKFGIDTSGMPDFADMQLKIEDTNANGEVVYLSNYTPTTSGNWSLYEIPMADFPANIDRETIKFLGLWNPSSVAGAATPVTFGILHFDDMQLVEATADTPSSPTAPEASNKAGIFSETHTTNAVSYEGIINSIDWGGNTTDADPNSTEVTALDGSTVLSVDYKDDAKGWGGAVFNFGDAGKDLSSYGTLSFGINTSGMADFADMQIKFEDVAANGEVVYLSNYTPTTSGDWSVYEIPLVDFPASIDRETIKFLGLWNPSSVAGAATPVTFGKLHFDDIHLVEGTSTPTTDPDTASAVGIFSETYTTNTLSNDGIINSVDWGGNTTGADPTSTAVTPLDGIYVLSVDYQDDAKGWGGAVFNFGDAGKDISANTKLKFGLDTSGMTDFVDMQIKFEDAAANGDVVYLSNYTPTTSGNWSVYEIPLADFPANIDRTTIKFLGLWNPSSVAGAPEPLTFGMLHFDDIHLVQ